MSIITVRVPDALDKRLEPFKSKVNISEICRDALESKCRSYELIEEALANDDVIAGLVERLKIERREFEDRSREYGMEDGRNWAIREASYADLSYWGDPDSNYNASLELSEGEDYPFPSDTGAQGHLTHRLSQATDFREPLEKEAYCDAFLRSVEEIWEKVAPKLD